MNPNDHFNPLETPANDLSSNPFLKNKVKTLRFRKKQEQDRIEEANKRIAKRINQAKSTIRSGDFDREFQIHAKLENGLRKIISNKILLRNES